MSLKLWLVWQVCSCLGCSGLRKVGFKQQSRTDRHRAPKEAAEAACRVHPGMRQEPRVAAASRGPRTCLRPDLPMPRLDPNETNELSMANSRFNIRHACSKQLWTLGE